ncbi:hypothetical protein IKG20_02445 [Candidatus Saccharibacteria bacterium]|nr:hypothetical protein [Candidatus Saccharibacteria bacterium]
MKLSSKIKTAVMAGVLALTGAGAALVPSAVYAETWQDGIDAAKADDVPEDVHVTVTEIINAVLYVVGILAVVMVIIGGVQYTTSGGDSAAVTKAKNTILYGIIGLVIAVLAYAIVNFVIGKVTGN